MQPVRGTYDLYGKQMKLHNFVLETIKSVVLKYNYSQIKTPIFEATDLFVRTTGESSDIVQKEIYEFKDKSDRSLSLRPELTAPVIRAYLTNKIFGERKKQYKFFYYGEAFRYERPQKGRFRQFYQFGIELLGENNAYSDVEVLTMAYNILEKLNLHKSVTLKINTIGLASERKAYNENLKKYFSKYKEELCDDCLKRLEINPLRILDCKKDGQKIFVKKAPKLKDIISEKSLENYKLILLILDNFKIPYVEDHTLVRGLDYYNDLVFEFEYKSKDGDLKTIIGGGRYDSLVEQLGGSTIPAIGFGIGLERMIDACYSENHEEIDQEIEEENDIFFIPQSKEAYPIILNSMNRLRKEGIICSANYQINSLKSQFKQAEDMNSFYVVIVGDEDIKKNIVKVKNMITKEEAVVALEDFEDDIISSEK